MSTDVAVLRQILVREEYRPVARLGNVHLVVDCGANIGVSAIYLLHCYPDARLIALEPDAENCELCRENLEAFADRARVIQAALWPHKERLRIVPWSRRLGAWALRVEPWQDGDVQGLPMEEVLQLSGECGPIDLLKIDIEGAEEEVFRGSPAWLRATRNIAIELHGEAAQAAVACALAPYHYTRVEAHELSIFYNLRYEPGKKAVV